jgi:hypothetical protein
MRPFLILPLSMYFCGKSFESLIKLFLFGLDLLLLFEFSLLTGLKVIIGEVLSHDLPFFALLILFLFDGLTILFNINTFFF